MRDLGAFMLGAAVAFIEGSMWGNGLNRGMAVAGSFLGLIGLLAYMRSLPSPPASS